MRAALETIATFSLFSKKKVVALLDVKMFAVPADAQGILKKAKEKYETGEIQKAARYFLSWMAAARIDFDHLPAILDENKGDPAVSGNRAWIDPVVQYCKTHDLSIPDVENDARILEAAVQQGFPKNHVLILTTDRVDRRMRLFQTIVEKGMAVDCTVPAGNRLAEKKIRDSILKECTDDILQENNKRLDRDACAALWDMTGFELGVLKANLEKLIAYIGTRKRITRLDVETVLSRTKPDPVFELTGALLEKDAEKALFFLHSLLRSDFHPMAVLSALVNQTRKLLVIKAFVEEEKTEAWRKEYEFKQFQTNTVPLLEKHAAQIEKAVSAWQTAGGGGHMASKAAKKKPGTPITDLLAVRGGAGAYPLFKLFQASERFEKQELFDALLVLCETDFRLKSTPLSPRLLLEKALTAICGVAPPKRRRSFSRNETASGKRSPALP
jgi:DNA polymerase-3 subunit delta